MSTLTDPPSDTTPAPSTSATPESTEGLSREMLRTLMYVGVAVAGLVLAVVVSFATRPRSLADYSDVGEAFYPDFTEATEAAGIRVAGWNEQAGRPETFEVRRDGTNWVVPTHSNYPVDGEEQLGRAAASVLDVRREALERSITPDDFAKYDLVDPLDEDASSEGRGRRVTLTSDDGETLVDYIVGQQAEEAGEGAYYIRRADEDRVYLARINLDVSTNFTDWVEPNLLDLATDEVVELTSSAVAEERDASGARTLERTELRRATTDDDWTIDGEVPDETTEGTIDTAAVNRIVTDLGGLELIGVRRKPPAMISALKGEGDGTVTTLDLLAIEERGFTIDGGRLVSLEGRLFAGQSDGVGYQLLFGSGFTGSTVEIEVGGEQSDEDETADEQTDGEAGEEPSDDAGETLRGRYVLVQAVFDKNLLPPLPPRPTKPKPEDTDGDEDTPDGDAPDGDESAETPADEESPVEEPDPMEQYQQELATYEAAIELRKDALAAGQKRADELNVRFADWFYVIPEDTFETLAFKRADVLTPPEPSDDGENAAETTSPSDSPNQPSAAEMFDRDAVFEELDLEALAAPDKPALPEGDVPSLDEEERQHLLEAVRAIAEPAE